MLDHRVTTEGQAGCALIRGCPLDPVLNVLARKWLVHIVWFLAREPSLRFAQLRRHLPGRVSAKVLSERLRQLERLAIIEREDKHTALPHVTYQLTAHGRAIDALLQGIEFQARKLSLLDGELGAPPAS
jgi:DNA-binding HxlR family transcriptional regulator